MQVCTSLQADNHAGTPLHSFLQAACPSCHPANSVKINKQKAENIGKSIGVDYHSKNSLHNILLLWLPVYHIVITFTKQTCTGLADL